MATDIAHDIAARARTIGAAAAAWRDPSSSIRQRAREALASGPWPAPVVETALDDVLWDLDETKVTELLMQPRVMQSRALERGPGRQSNEFDRSSPWGRPALRVLVVLPGNIIGPAIQSAFCAAIGGAQATLKASSVERHLAALAAEQFEELGPPLAGCVSATHWQGGDLDAEAHVLGEVDRVIAFGDDSTIEQIRERASARNIGFIGYGESYSIGYAGGGADIALTARAASRDICLFDQRGCMSPQTIYVAGDRGRATLFARTLARAIELRSRELPRAPFETGERAQLADAVRRLSASALEPPPHGLDTLVLGPEREGVPEFAVAVEAFGRPACFGFGRIVAVKPCGNARDVAAQLKYYGRPLETVGLAADGASDDVGPAADRGALRLAQPRRVCALGEMQRPPFGYRPAIEDFLA